ncbi:MAG: DUF1127 domain-containing protein [Rhodocyclaceae bacterium]|nr:DUF1127 domain-containing protein [Rhodocyclaceae bacterium]
MFHPAQALSLPRAARRSALARQPLLLRLAGLVVLWARRHRARAELRVLDPHILRDIGVSRAQADFEADKPFWRD